MPPSLLIVTADLDWINSWYAAGDALFENLAWHQVADHITQGCSLDDKRDEHLGGRGELGCLALL